MAFSFLREILQSGTKRRKTLGSRGPTPFRPRLEALEDRLLMATRIWDGDAAPSDLNWTNPLNWQANIAPVEGDDLVFDDASSSASRNDFAGGPTFNSITISRAFVLIGNGIELGPGGLLAQNLTADDIDIRFGVPLDLNASSGAVRVLNGAAADTTLTLEGRLGSNGHLTKTGDGRLSLTQSDFLDETLEEMVVQEGVLRIQKNMTIDNGKVASGAVLELSGTTTSTGTGGLTITVTGGLTVASGGVLELSRTVNVIGVFSTGGLLTLNGGTLRNGPIPPGEKTNFFNGNIVLGAASTITSESGILSLSRNIDNGGFVLTVDGAGTTVFGGGMGDAVPGCVCIGPGLFSGAGGLTKNGTGTLTLEGTGINTYSGVTTVNAGVLRLEKPSALGSASGGTHAADGAILELDGGITVTGEPLTFSGISLPLRSRHGTNTWGGSVFLNGFTTVSADTDPLRLSGIISGAPGSGLTKINPGRLELTGNNTYTGDTRIFEGTVRVNGQQASSRARFSTGTLEGTGTVGGIDSFGGSVSPGSGGFGVLTSLGNVAFDAASTFVAQVVPIAGIPSDRLAVTGTVKLNNAALVVQPPFLPSATPGATFQIIGNDGTDSVIGTFLNRPQNSTFTVQVQGGPAVLQTQFYKINYHGGDGNDVVLTYLNSATMARDLAVTPAIVNEGEQVTLTGRLVDPDRRGALTLQVNWGDGSPVQTRHPGTGPFRLTHRYRDNPAGQPSDGQYRITVTWFDQHGAGNSQDRFVTVNNVAPSVDAGGRTTVRAGAMFVRNGSFTDPGADIWTATVDYGDGTGVQPLDLNSARRFQLRHRYVTPGAYTVVVTVRDDDGGVSTDSMVVTVKSRHPGDAISALDAVFRDNLLGNDSLIFRTPAVGAKKTDRLSCASNTACQPE